MLAILCHGLMWIVFLTFRPTWDQECRQHLYLGARGKLEIRHRNYYNNSIIIECEIPQDKAMPSNELKGS